MNAFLLACTVPAAAHLPHHSLFRPFHLGIENNPATWWSAMQLLLFGLLAHTNALAFRDEDLPASRAWLLLAGMGFALFTDEMASIHERSGYFIPVIGRFTIPLLAAVAAALLFGSLAVLYRRRRQHGKIWVLVPAALVLFAFAYILEMIEHQYGLSGLRHGFRTMLEEGAELTGVFLLLLAAARGRRFAVPAGESNLLPSSQAVASVIRLAAMLSIPVILIRARFAPGMDGLPPGGGDFGMVIPVFVFAAASLLAWREARRGSPARRAWLGLAAVLALMSLAAETHPHRYVLGYVSSRYDIDLLAGIPLLALAAARVKELRRWEVFAGFAAFFILAGVSVFAVPKLGLAVALFHFVSLAAAATVIWAAARSQLASAQEPSTAAPVVHLPLHPIEAER